MIITALLSVVTALISFVLSPLPSIPDFPPAVQSILDSITDYLVQGMGFINAITNGAVLSTIITVSAAIFVLYEAYVFLMWVLRKIPVLGIE